MRVSLLCISLACLASAGCDRGHTDQAVDDGPAIPPARNGGASPAAVRRASPNHGVDAAPSDDHRSGDGAGRRAGAASAGTRSHAGAQRPIFEEVAGNVGLSFRHHCGTQGQHVLLEIMGGGAAVFDADTDGWLDVYLIDSGDHLPRSGKPVTTPNRLFRQRRDGTFADVTEASGLGDTGYGMGCAVGDIDNDGDLDVYVTNWGPDVLYRNNGGGTFDDVTGAFGINDARWSMSAAFFDYDRDGYLDLFVTQYVDLDVDRRCTDNAGRRDYCGPQPFPGVADVLYHNEAGERFVDASAAAGIAQSAYAGLGVVCADFNDDGWPDIYVANDGDPNNFWINQHDGTFRDDAVITGCAFNKHGLPEAGMGVTAGDADADGDLDLFVAHLRDETNTYYHNLGDMGFDDATASAQLGTASAPYTGFGAAFFDYNNDGALDLAVVNGAVTRRPRALADRPPFWNDYVEPNLLFANDGTGTFRDAAADAGAFATHLGNSRAFVPADIDRDGDLDVLVTEIEGRPRLYRNRLDVSRTHWLQLRVIDPQLNREALGAKVTLHVGDRQLVRHAIPPGGYLTGQEALLHVGLGEAPRVDRIDVRWPDGSVERFPGCASRQRITLRRGGGRGMS